MMMLSRFRNILAATHNIDSC